MIERVGPEAFDGEQLRRRGIVVVGFLADWCPFCVRFLPDLDELARKGATVLHADLTDEESPLWDRFRVAIVPTLIVFHDGTEVFRRDGIAGVGLGRTDSELVLGEVARLRRGGGASPP